MKLDVDDRVGHHLRRMRERLSRPERWTREAMARDRHGAPVLPTSEAATCWCVIGAYQCEVESLSVEGRAWLAPRLLCALQASAQRVYGCGALSWFNDERGHEAVLAVIDDALLQPLPPRCGAEQRPGDLSSPCCALAAGHGEAADGALSVPHLGLTADGDWRSWREGG